MNTPPLFEEALALALRLAPRERLKLIERVASSVEREIDVSPTGEAQSDQHWGRNLLRLLDELGPVEMSYPEIEDPVEWVRQIRRDERTQRLEGWGEDE